MVQAILGLKMQLAQAKSMFDELEKKVEKHTALTQLEYDNYCSWREKIRILEQLLADLTTEQNRQLTSRKEYLIHNLRGLIKKIESAQTLEDLEKVVGDDA